jgi:hypothetical protein
MTADTDRFSAKMGSLRIYAGNFVTRSSSLESTAIDIVLKFAPECARSQRRLCHYLSHPAWTFVQSSIPKGCLPAGHVGRQLSSSYWCQKFACCCQSWLPSALVVKPADVCCQWWPNPSDVESGETVVDLSPVVELPNACSHQWWPPRAEAGETVVSSVEELPNICCHQW